MATEDHVVVRQISELQTDAARVVAEADKASVEIRRYSKPVAYIEGVEQHREDLELRAAFNRTLWGVDLARALRNVSEGKLKEWGEVAAVLRARYPGR